MTGSARDRAIEKRPVEDLLREYDIPEKDIPELAAAMKEAATPTVPDTSDVPEVWWSPSLGVVQSGDFGGYGQAVAVRWTEVAELPSDAVRLVPATPTDAIHAGALALALHDADCGCDSYDQVEDPRYITAVRRVLDELDATPRTAVLAAESVVMNILMNADEQDVHELARSIVAEVRQALPTPVRLVPAAATGAASHP